MFIPNWISFGSRHGTDHQHRSPLPMTDNATDHQYRSENRDGPSQTVLCLYVILFYALMLRLYIIITTKMSKKKIEYRHQTPAVVIIQPGKVKVED